jgi:hypothetical protein
MLGRSPGAPVTKRIITGNWGGQKETDPVEKGRLAQQRSCAPLAGMRCRDDAGHRLAGGPPCPKKRSIESGSYRTP